MTISPLINLINTVISLYTTGLIIWLVLNILSRFEVINSHNQFVRKVMNFGYNLYEPILYQIRRVIPLIGSIDLSPLVLLLLLNFVRGILFSI